MEEKHLALHTVVNLLFSNYSSKEHIFSFIRDGPGVFDLIASIAGIYAAVRGIMAFFGKTDTSAKAFKLSMLILFIVCVVVYIIKSIVQFEVAYDMLAIYGFSVFATVITLIAYFIVATLCCGFCYTQATRYQKYLEYYEEARHRSVYS